METFRMKIRYIIIFLLCSIATYAEDFPYRYLPPFAISPTEELACMYFDSEGMMWIGTNAGVKSYDGYSVKTYKASAFQPGILPNNTIRSIVEDHQNNLWLGTRNGLVRMNKRTGEFKTFFLPEREQSIIYMLQVTRDGTLWIGTDGGLTRFDAEKETFYIYNNVNTWLIDESGHKKRIGRYSVKSLVEDRNGDLLIGTWSSGLLRMKRGSHVMYSYPKLNATNSAYSLFLDSQHHLWVGTWGYGIVRIDNPDDIKHPVYHQYPYSTNHFDTYFKVVEDPVSKKLWACTREGVSYIDPKKPNAEWQQYSTIGSHPMNLSNDIATDGYGNIWLCTQNFGIMQIDTKPSLFKLNNLNTSKARFIINYIYSMMTPDGEWFWLGLNPYGIALYNRKTGQTLYSREIPGFESLTPRFLTTSISGITQRSNGEIWFANNNYGLIVRAKDGKTVMRQVGTCPYIKENFVNTIFESRDHVMWIGQRSGLSIVYPNDKGVILKNMKDGDSDLSLCDIRHISQDKQGNIWLATENEGIIRISGNPHQPKSLKYKQYNPTHHNFAIDDATACLEDSHGRLWSISNSGGLFLYNKVNDCFEPKNKEYHLQGDRAFAIQEDKLGNLWITTDQALVQLMFEGNNPQEKPKNIISFSKEDGLGDLLFTPNTACSYDKELFFGSRTSFFSITPTANMRLNNQKKSKLCITDILIDDTSFAQLDSDLKADISKKMPTYTDRICLPADIKKVSIEFALLTYGNAEKNGYAYLLKGYDKDWQYCSGKDHQATFQNLSSGTYHLHVKATDNYGKWQELPYTITIKVLPPWYASHWAYMIYILLIIGGGFAFARWYKEHLKTRSRLQMGVILTNITHELLTPLTVISATIYKLKSVAPQYKEDYLVMDSNINRTTRLLRQILEVRKSQAGQLRLLVSRGDLAAFVKNACENIRPMAEHAGISLIEQVPEKEHMVWFDSDKLDKILYNLLSNAIKYNKENGSIHVSLTIDKTQATITIADNGIGMSKEKQKHLYTRFFDGDYRKQNMPGTGIGLSLTHDLVKLHHGDIRCESAEGKGTTFIVSFPIKKSAYAAEEVDTSSISKQVDKQTIEAVIQEMPQATDTVEKESEKNALSTAQPNIIIKKGMKRILVVEDNEELLALMHQMLSQDFHVFTAKNGKQALNVINKEQLDLVVSDVMMPVMDGIELTKAIKNDKGFWQLPVILLTSKNKEEDKTEGYAIGADAYVTKPFKFEELSVRINAIIDNRKKIQESIVQEVAASDKEKDTSDKEKSLHFSDPDKAFIKRATELVMQHLNDSDYDRDTFAKDMAMGSSTLYNKVKATTGQTVVSFITSIRLKESKRIMDENPGILISDVAAKVGFNTPKYFSKCFKKEFGLFPKEYMEQSK